MFHRLVRSIERSRAMRDQIDIAHSDAISTQISPNWSEIVKGFHFYIFQVFSLTWIVSETCYSRLIF